MKNSKLRGNTSTKLDRNTEKMFSISFIKKPLKTKKVSALTSITFIQVFFQFLLCSRKNDKNLKLTLLVNFETKFSKKYAKHIPFVIYCCSTKHFSSFLARAAILYF